MFSIRTFLRSCPSCGRRFGVKFAGKTEVDDLGEKETREQTNKFVSGLAYQTGHTGSEVNEMADTKEFRLSYRCKYCGHQWSAEQYQTTLGRIEADYKAD